MEHIEKKEWATQNMIENALDRGNILLQLRYQLAFGIMVLIAGVWTILVPYYADKTFNFIFLGWMISTILIIGWRVFTHFIFFEENAIGISILYGLNDLGLVDTENPRLRDIEKQFKLKENKDYQSFDTIKEKLAVITKLQYHLPESGLNIFDGLSICLIIGSGVLLIYFNYLIIDQISGIILIGSFLIISGIFFWAWPFKFPTFPSEFWSKRAIKWAIKEINEMKKEPSDH
jgi:hypothetical protein